MRKARYHQTGATNLDFRTKQDTKSLQIFQPWTITKSYGTMGHSNYHLSDEEYKKFFSVSERINMMKNKVAEAPDPRIYNSALFYKSKHIPINTKAFVINDRIAQLEETSKGKDTFTGDSLMYSDTIKFRTARTKQLQSVIDQKKKRLDRYLDESHPSDLQVHKEELNIDNITPNDQIKEERKSDLNKSLESYIDKQRLINIRENIRNRYANRKHGPDLFRDWDISNQGEVSVYDAHMMINRIGIPIDYNETKALLMTANDRGTDSLNLPEFMQMVFSDNKEIKYNNLSKSDCLDKNSLNNPQIINSFKKILQPTKTATLKPNELIYIENYIRSKVPLFMNMLKIEGDTTNCSKETLSRVLKKFPLSDKYTSMPVINAICDNYPSNGDSSKVNIQEFIDSCCSKNKANYFFDAKDLHMSLSKQRLSRAQSDFTNELINIQSNARDKNTLREFYLDQIEEKKQQKKLDRSTSGPYEESSMQPSAYFLNKIFADGPLYRERIEQEMRKVSSLPSLCVNQRKTRSGANPITKNTNNTVQPDPQCSMFMNENERFKIKGNDRIDFVSHEKEQKILEKEQINLRLAKITQAFEHRQHNEDLLLYQKKIIADYHKAARSYNYEHFNNVQNQLFEE